MDAMTRRQLLLTTPLLFARSSGSRMSVEGYIFQQYATRQKKPLGDVLSEAFDMAHSAGFHNIELNNAFLSPAIRDKAFGLLKTNQLNMPSVYVGGTMHTLDDAAATQALALETAVLCKPFGCAAVVNNPSPKPAGAQKTDPELKIQASALNDLGQILKRNGFELRVHHHTPELVDNAREWRHILQNTNPKYVKLCLDLDWIHQGGLKPLDLLKEAGPRVKEIHVRNAKDKLWLEDFEGGDIDYREIAAFLRREKIKPLVVVELAYRPETVVTRSLGEDLRLSRIYAEQVFGISA
jgi:inosose dehydratase